MNRRLITIMLLAAFIAAGASVKGYAAKKYASRENFEIYFYDEVSEEKLRVSQFDLAHEVWMCLRDELGFNRSSYAEENIRSALCNLLA